MPNVKIRVEAVSDDELQAQKQGEEVKGKKDTGTGKLAVASIFAHQMINFGKQTLNYAVSTIGMRTGDYIKQERIQDTLSVIGDISTVATATITGGWAGLAISIMGLTAKTVMEQVSIANEQKRAEIDASYLRERSGNSTKNGSRTGE